MRLHLPICNCEHLSRDHHAGSGHCAVGTCKCLHFKKLHGGGSKMRNVREKGKGDSNLERDREAELRLLLYGGYIRNLRPHEVIDVTPPFSGYRGLNITWRADFQYQERIAGKWVDVIEDSKCSETMKGMAEIKIKLAMGKFCPPALMRISHRNRRGAIVVETLTNNAGVRVDFGETRRGRAA